MLRYLAIIVIAIAYCVPDNNPIYALLDIVIIYITFVIERKSIRRLGININ